MGRKRGLGVALAALLCLASVVVAAPPVMVVIPAPSRSGGDSASWAPFNYGVAVRVHGKATLAGFVEDTKLARLLVFEAGSYPDANALLSAPEGQAAVTAFLKSGGAMVFLFKAGPVWWGSKTAEAFLRKNGVYLPPQDLPGGRYAVAVAKAAAHPLLTTPNNLAALPDKDLPARAGPSTSRSIPPRVSWP